MAKERLWEVFYRDGMPAWRVYASSARQAVEEVVGLICSATSDVACDISIRKRLRPPEEEEDGA